MISLAEAEWKQRRADHQQRVEPWLTPRLQRKQRGERHPVDDFLFDYYPYSPAKLQRWHPGFGAALLGDDSALADFLAHDAYHRTPAGVTVDPARIRRHAARLRLVHRILSQTESRPAQFGCFGMHEWAMVYGAKQDSLRHASVPLRLAPQSIRAVVDEVGLRCTHIDAYRFFTPEALPRNQFQPTRANQPDLEQRGCVHANMDLYKYATWFTPFIGSERVADAFELAREARDLDMRAAPYDLTAFGYQPLRLESVEGRREYADRQRALAERAQPIRRALLSDVSALLTSVATPYQDSRSLLDPTPA